MKKPQLIFASYAVLAAMVLGAIVYYNQGEISEVLVRFTSTTIIISILICAAIFLISGIETSFLVSTQSDKQLSLFDICTLTISGAFWGYLLPFKGGVAYSFYILKRKYGVRFAQGAAFVLVSYMLTISTVGLIGLWYFARSSTFNSFGIGISIIMTANPILLFALRILLFQIPQVKNRLITILRGAIDDMFATVSVSFRSAKIITVLLLLMVARITLRLVWYWWLLYSLHLYATIPQVASLTLVAEVANIFTLIPGNFGVNEVLSATVFSVFGQNIGIGVIIEMIIRFSAMFLAFTVGLWAIVYNMQKLGITSLRSLKSDLAQEIRSITR